MLRRRPWNQVAQWLASLDDVVSASAAQRIKQRAQTVQQKTPRDHSDGKAKNHPPLASWIERALIAVEAASSALRGASTNDEVRRLSELSRLLEEQQRAQRQLEQRRTELMDVFRRAPNEMLITRMSDLCILDVNDAWVRSSGYPRELVVGKSSLDFPWWSDPEVRDRIVSTIHQRGHVDAIEASFIDAAGKEHITLMSGQSVVLDGELCVVWQSQDITAIRRSEREQRELDERAKQKEKLRSLGVLAGGIAHELNNKLVGVLGNADFLLSKVNASSPIATQLRAIAASAEQAASVTRELLDYSGRGGRAHQPVELRALLGDTALLARGFVPAEAKLSTELPEEEVWIEGDPSQLSRMLLNLVKNGGEALEGRKGQVTLSLSVEKRSDEERAVVRVSDDGRGMDEETRRRIFDPFFTTKSSGRGLGLSAVQGIVERHHGEIAVASAPGRGTTFTASWPRKPAPHPSKGSDHEPVTNGRGRILVVDDEPSVRATASLLLTTFGFDVTEVGSGEDALEALAREPEAFRLVMLDASMPGIDGWTTLQRLRERWPELPVLFCSGYSHLDSVKGLAKVPHARFLGKPFRAAELSHEVAALLQES